MAKDLIDTDTNQYHDSKTLKSEGPKRRKQEFVRAVKRDYQRRDQTQKTR